MHSDTSGDPLIAELTERYARIATYRDRGVVRQALREGEAPIETQFETWFRRPGLFKFAFASPHPYPPLAHIVTRSCHGADASGAYSWMKFHEQPGQIRREENLSMTIAGATGISGGSAHTIGGLLLPELSGLTLHRVRGAKVLGREPFEGAECVILQAPHRVAGKLSIWIHEETMTLRKLVTHYESHPPAEEIRRNIEIDGPIADTELERPS